ncbi:hypothetical protein BDR07DRAFT_1606514 [Suillus spraguei]|nr:hypothetical protein BDR07DRAFT_1606514 [Suillus spraguei]
MSCIVPYDGLYRLQNVAYPTQVMGYRFHDGLIVSCDENPGSGYSVNWQIKANSIAEYGSKITIQTIDGVYISAYSGKVVTSGTPFEWALEYREDGKWVMWHDGRGLAMPGSGTENPWPMGDTGGSFLSGPDWMQDTATTNFEDIINFLFPQDVVEDADTCLHRSFLSPLNIYVDEFDDTFLDNLSGDYHPYFSSDNLKEAEHAPLNVPYPTTCNVNPSWINRPKIAPIFPPVTSTLSLNDIAITPLLVTGAIVSTTS